MPHPPYDPLVIALLRARGASQLALDMALQALATEGAGGSLTIHIPRKGKDIVEVDFHLRNDHPDFR